MGLFGGKKKLYAEGAQTEGVVLKQASANDRIHFQVVVRARFPDGSTTEFRSQFLDVYDVGSLYQGSVVPVRYDPSDHSKIALDIPVLEARQKQASAAQEVNWMRRSRTSGSPVLRPRAGPQPRCSPAWAAAAI
jgi:hypothetical protein